MRDEWSEEIREVAAHAVNARVDGVLRCPLDPAKAGPVLARAMVSGDTTATAFVLHYGFAVPLQLAARLPLTLEREPEGA